MIVRTRDLSTPSSQKFYEVWLLNPTTQKMFPVGVLPPSGNGDYEVTAGLMAGYSAVDVSLQADDGSIRTPACCGPPCRCDQKRRTPR